MNIISVLVDNVHSLAVVVHEQLFLLRFDRLVVKEKALIVVLWRWQLRRSAVQRRLHLLFFLLLRRAYVPDDFPPPLLLKTQLVGCFDLFEHFVELWVGAELVSGEKSENHVHRVRR